MDVVVLARSACLSVAQVRQLESSDSRDNLFYSSTIKRQAYRRLLAILGAEPPPLKAPEALHDAHKVASAHLNTLDQIVAMSHQPAINRTFADVMHEFFSKLKAHRQSIAAFIFLVAAVLLFIWNGSQKANEPVDAPQETAKPQDTKSQAAPTVTAAPAVPASSAEPALPTASSPASASVSPVAEPAAKTVVPSAAAASACAFATDTLPQITPWMPQKEGRYVYMVSPTNTEICVVDGNKQATLLSLKAGESKSVYGPAPWQLSGNDLKKIQIYFQGWRVVLPEGVTTRFQLIEKSLTSQ